METTHTHLTCQCGAPMSAHGEDLETPCNELETIDARTPYTLEVDATDVVYDAIVLLAN